MRPGITIRHTAQAPRHERFVRSDIGALIGFVTRERWPEDASSGDFLELVLERSHELDEHPQRGLFDDTTARAVRYFFHNGGVKLHVYGVCVDSIEDLRERSGDDGVLGPLLHRLRTEDDISLIAVPSAAYWRCEVLRGGRVRWDAEALYDELLQHCRQMTHRFCIVDPPQGLHGDLLFRWFDSWRQREQESRGYGAIYYPWINHRDQSDPPSGAIMGVYARLCLERPPFGIGNPPANVPILGATHTTVEMDWAEVGLVSEGGLNPLIVQPGRGVVIWGARTMSMDRAWRFVNSRRIVGMITEQLRRDNEWVVFEPITASLWKIVERDVAVRLQQFWDQGLIAGTRSRSEFSVQCSEANNPLVARESGSVHVDIQLTPVGTTEHIQIDLRLGDGTT